MLTQNPSTTEQARRIQQLYSAVVLAVIDDAIKDQSRIGTGADDIVRWAGSRDGREVLMNAGIEPNSRTAAGLMRFVEQGQPTNTALSRRSKQREAMAAAV